MNKELTSVNFSDNSNIIMATKKRSRGRPKLSVAERRARSDRTKISFEMTPYQVAILESWMDDSIQLGGLKHSKASACLKLVMDSLVNGREKPEMDKVFADWQKRTK